MGLKGRLKLLALSQIACKFRATKSPFSRSQVLCVSYLDLLGCSCSGLSLYAPLPNQVIRQWLCLGSLGLSASVLTCNAGRQLSLWLGLPEHPHSHHGHWSLPCSSQHGGWTLRTSHSRPARGLESVSSESSRSLAAAYLQTLSSKQPQGRVWVEGLRIAEIMPQWRSSRGQRHRGHFCKTHSAAKKGVGKARYLLQTSKYLLEFAVC